MNDLERDVETVRGSLLTTYWTGWRVRDADTLEAELGTRAFWCLVRENGRRR